MVWCRAPHPPAGATTLVVSLGILRGPSQLGVLMLAVVLLVVRGWVMNRLAGIDDPLWHGRERSGARLPAICALRAREWPPPEPSRPWEARGPDRPDAGNTRARAAQAPRRAGPA
jgi:hypothetical protein